MEQALSLYKIFYVVASEGNISRASKELYISQPAISKSIQKLEQNLNTTLFHRTSRGVILTDEGKLLYEHVGMAFQTLEIAERQIQKGNELGMGHLRIGVSTTLCKYVLLPYLQSFIEAHPHIQISIECQSTKHTLEMLEAGSIDIGLVGQPVALSKMKFVAVGEIQDTFVATKSYMDHLYMRTTSETDIFKNATLMLLDKENLTRQYIDDYLNINHIETGSILEINTMDLLIDFAKIGLGIACVIKNFVQDELNSEVLQEIPLQEPLIKRKIGFAYTPVKNLSYELQEFLSQIQK